MTDDGTFEEFEQAFDWIAKLPHKVKVLVAGTPLSIENKAGVHALVLELTALREP